MSTLKERSSIYGLGFNGSRLRPPASLVVSTSLCARCYAMQNGVGLVIWGLYKGIATKYSEPCSTSSTLTNPLLLRPACAAFTAHTPLCNVFHVASAAICSTNSNNKPSNNQATKQPTSQASKQGSKQASKQASKQVMNQPTNQHSLNNISSHNNTETIKAVENKTLKRCRGQLSRNR